jgi:hypothetical protein
MAVMMIPRHRPTHGCAATNIKFFGNEAKRTLELPSSDDGKRAITLISTHDPLSTSLRQGTQATCLTR